jgi:hypothetical protein
VVNLRDGVAGRPGVGLYGLDIGKGELVDTVQERITSEKHSFALVREKFMLEVGQSIGIAVVFKSQSKPTNKTIAGVGENYVAISDKEIELIYGSPDTVNIYTGKITYVGETHIEYNINSFTGCSGAIVFLLDNNQPPSVQSCDFGKAVAVHSQSHPILSKLNLGFKIRCAATPNEQSPQ